MNGEKQSGTCTLCGSAVQESSLQAVDDQWICTICLEEASNLCTECGERFWRSDDAGCEGIALCQICYDRDFTHCCHCGTLVRRYSAYNEDPDGYEERYSCDVCYCEPPGENPIQDYYFKPTPVFYGDGSRHFGVELELDEGGEIGENAYILMEIGNRNGDYLYIKHDGSLSDGMELVTHPMTLEYQRYKMPWAELCQKALSLGYLSHRASSCGLHVHISRLAFGATEAQQDSVIARILYFFEKHWEELLKFSRRTQRQLDHWAARYGYKDQPKEILDFAKKGAHSGRYTCVNLQNEDTVEFRMFRGTLKSNTIFATLQLLNCICDVALTLSDDELKSMAWTSFVAGIQPEQYPELVQYLKEQRLYINEPIETEGEA